jgi:hypothetical protein
MQPECLRRGIRKNNLRCISYDELIFAIGVWQAAESSRSGHGSSTAFEKNARSPYTADRLILSSNIIVGRNWHFFSEAD